MALRLLARLVLLAALLAAQQVALSHPITHVGAADPAVSAGTGEAPKAPLLCELHDVLGAMLGVLHGASAATTEAPHCAGVQVALPAGEPGPQRFLLFARGPPASS